ncbi:MAG: hypothetical protein AB7F35_15475 [Acetobacteraceae bacterium]
MSGPNDPLGGAAESVARLIQQHNNAPPHIQNANRLGLGTFLVVACGYVAAWSPVFLGADIRRLIALAAHAPSQAPVALWVWAGCFVLGILWVCTGFRGPHGPGSTMGTFWAGVRIALCLCALNQGWYLPQEWGGWTINLALRGFYFAFLAEAGVDLFLALRRPAGDARKIVSQQIEQQTVTMRPVKRH